MVSSYVGFRDELVRASTKIFPHECRLLFEYTYAVSTPASLPVALVTFQTTVDVYELTELSPRVGWERGLASAPALHPRTPGSGKIGMQKNIHDR
jgi:hypothetical protein